MSLDQQKDMLDDLRRLVLELEKSAFIRQEAILKINYEVTQHAKDIDVLTILVNKLSEKLDRQTSKFNYMMGVISALATLSGAALVYLLRN